MQLKARIMDGETLCRTVRRISFEIVEKNKGTDDLCIVGVRRRGERLAEMIAENIYRSEGVHVPCGAIDIKFYRDDLTHRYESLVISTSELGFDIVNKKVVLVDDVLYTGRTVRAAIDAIFSIGRPRAIRLAILIDRGHRELPFRADYIGKSIPTAQSERVSVLIPPYDDTMGVELYGE